MYTYALQWHHNVHDGVSNHQPHDCLLNRLFKAQNKENTNTPRDRWPVNSPHKGPVTRKMFPFDDFIMVGVAVIIGVSRRVETMGINRALANER